MTALELVSAMEKEFLRYEELRRGGALFGAMAALGGVANAMALLEPEARGFWEARVKTVQVTPGTLAQINVECRREVSRLQRLVSQFGSFGSRSAGPSSPSWEREELILIVSSRVCLDLVSEVVRFLGHVIDLEMSEVDRLVWRVEASEKDAATYESAQQQCARLWGLPIQSRWLGTGEPTRPSPA